MRLLNSRKTYGWPSRLLHWMMAALVIGLFALGYWMRTLDYYDPWYQRAPNLHMSLGVLLIALLAVRIVWRFSNPKPRSLAKSWVEQTVSSIAHVMMYLVLIGLSVTGYLFATGGGKPINVFDWFEVPPLITAKTLADRAGEIHEWLAYGIMAIAAVHAIGALKHHFLDRDDTLVRMISGHSPQSENLKSGDENEEFS